MTLVSYEALQRIVAAERSHDHIRLDTNENMQALFTDRFKERVLWSGYVGEMEEDAGETVVICIVTGLGLYTLYPHDLKTYKRYISLSSLASLTLSENKDDAVLHMIDSYDLWIRTKRRFELCTLLGRLYAQLYRGTKDLHVVTCTQKQISSLFVSHTSFVQKQLDVDARSSVKMSMTNRIRGLVSKKKIRYQEDDYDLDLTYITDRVIAMGFPSEDMEGLYRNPLREVHRLLTSKHKDRFKVYNLCSERAYDPNKFARRVALYPFDDHNCPPLRLILDFCTDVHEWLQSHRDNVVAIHCKAGKGRTGLMISCYLLFREMYTSAESSLGYFGEKRTLNSKGVTIPSQRRYVHYFERFLKECLWKQGDPRAFFQGIPLILTNLRIRSVPKSGREKGCYPYFTIMDTLGKQIYDSRKYAAVEHAKDVEYIDVPARACLRGDFKLVCWTDDASLSSAARESVFAKELFHLWLHTAFLGDRHVVLSKFEVDKAHKDKQHKKFAEHFHVKLFFRYDDILMATELQDTTTEEEKMEQAEEMEQRLRMLEKELARMQIAREVLDMDLEAELRENQMIRRTNATLRRGSIFGHNDVPTLAMSELVRVEQELADDEDQFDDA